MAGNPSRVLKNPCWLRVLGSGLRAVRVIHRRGRAFLPSAPSKTELFRSLLHAPNIEQEHEGACGKNQESSVRAHRSSSMIVFQEGWSVEYQTTPSIVNVQWWFDIEASRGEAMRLGGHGAQRRRRTIKDHAR